MNYLIINVIYLIIFKNIYCENISENNVKNCNKENNNIIAKNNNEIHNNKIVMCWKNLSHTITSEQECISENILSSLFMETLANNICINEYYFSYPHCSKQLFKGMYNSPPTESYNKKLFYYWMEKEGFNNTYIRLLNTKKNVAIFNFWHDSNYGAILTAYALQESLLKLGYNPYLIKNTNKRKVTNSMNPFKKFEQDNFFSSEDIYPSQLYKLNKYYDNFIVGSDQVWRWTIIKYKDYRTYFLNFVEKYKKKIACAASFGLDHWIGEKNVTREIKGYIKRFDAISVREKSGVNVLKNTFGVKSKQIFDPVFYLNRKEWEELFENKSNINLNKSCWIYMLFKTDKIADQINDILKGMNIKQFWIKKGNTTIYDFLKSIRTSEKIITDSFHGTCFSIIFHKDFLCLAKKGRFDERMLSLLTELGLIDRLIYDLNEVNWYKLLPIDYEKVDKIIEQKRKEGFDFLLENLEN